MATDGGEVGRKRQNKYADKWYKEVGWEGYFKCNNNNGTNATVVSDTVNVRHHSITIPTVTPEDCISHGLQLLTHALEDAPVTTCNTELEDISTLQDILGKWQDNSPSPSTSPMPTPLNQCRVPPIPPQLRELITHLL